MNMPSSAEGATAISSTTTPVTAASLGPPLCSPDESVLESLVAVLVAAIIFLAALILAVLLFACSSQQTRREPHCSHDHRHHHCSKRRRRRSLQEVRSRACCGGDEDVELFCDRRETTAVGGAPRRFDYGSSAGRSSSPDVLATKKSPYHPGYNSPATTSRAPPPSRRREGFRKSSYASPGGARSDLAQALHSTALQSGVSRKLTREHRAPAAVVGTGKPPSGDTSDSSRRSAETGSDTRSLEWDNFQPPLATTSWPSFSELCTDESFSIAATDGSQQQQRRPLSTQREHWV